MRGYGFPVLLFTPPSELGRVFIAHTVGAPVAGIRVGYFRLSCGS